MSDFSDLPGPRPQTLRSYAVLADGERAAVIGPLGDIAFLSFPSWASPTVFDGLLGGGASFVITPRTPSVWGGYYEDGSLVWHTRWVSGDSIVECHEALAFPGDRRRAVLLRRLVGLEGAMKLRLRLDLRPDYGRCRLALHPEGAAFSGESGGVRARLIGARAARLEEGRVVEDLVIARGERRDFVLELDTAALPEALPVPHRLWDETRAAWFGAVPQLPGICARRDARAAVAVLQGLRRRGGGMVAAATTSLPERADRGRNYDYRYVWMRDQCYAGHAASEARVFDLLDDSVRFLRERLLEDGPGLRPAYTIDGAPVEEQHRIDHLPGYPGAPQVLVGNTAGCQFQLDCFGEALLLFASAGRHDRLDGDTLRAAEVAVKAVEQRWNDADAGLWEIEARHWTHSRLICVAGLKAWAGHERDAALKRKALALAETILKRTASEAVHPTGHWQRSPDDPRVDASLLTAPIRGAVSADDPRSRATLQAIHRTLTQEGYVFRFRLHEQPLGQAEGAFLLCQFWMALAHLQVGDAVHAVEWFERGRGACGSPGLFTEEFDVLERQQRGNLPQAFVHALFLETACRMTERLGTC